MRLIAKGCGILLLVVVSICLGVIMVFVSHQKSKDKQDWKEYRPYIVQESALYIYNHYDGVERLEYSDFLVGSFGLGSHTYNVDILVNKDHEFSLGMLWDRDVYESGAIWAYENRDHPIANLPRKDKPTSFTELPDSVILIDKTAKAQ